MHKGLILYCWADHASNWQYQTELAEESFDIPEGQNQDQIFDLGECMPLYAQFVNMEGLGDGEENQYFEENPKIIPLFEIDVVEIIKPYLGNEDKEVDVPVDDKTLMELCHP